jgi:hypothetical protein
VAQVVEWSPRSTGPELNPSAPGEKKKKEASYPLAVIWYEIFFTERSGIAIQ